MPLTKSRGNMYPWVTHTHAHLGGECPHRCSYCYVDSPRFGRPEKFTGKMRLFHNELAVRYGANRTIFVDHCNDLFAEAVPQAWVELVMAHCRAWPNNDYVFQTKNPARILKMLPLFPPSCILGCTLETNRDIPAEISVAPRPVARCAAMGNLSGSRRQLFVTVEPIMDFDVEVLAPWLIEINPAFVNIGADSKGRNLPEPPPAKVRALIAALTAAGVEIRAKHNLDRLLKGAP